MRSRTLDAHREPLTEDRLARLVPSIFAEGGADSTSSRYSFIPTINVVRGLQQAGFQPIFATQSRTRIDGREGYVKHMLKFRHIHATEQSGVLPEITLINAHDGSSSYQLRASLFRMVCANGLIVASEYFTRKIRHSGEVVGKVVEAASELIDVLPLSVERVQEWQGIELNRDQQLAFASTALQLKWEKDQAPVNEAEILVPKRIADNRRDLWSTFNVVQENMIRGGIRYETKNGSTFRTRGVNSVGENVRLNTALWTLTEKMAELVTK